MTSVSPDPQTTQSSSNPYFCAIAARKFRDVHSGYKSIFVFALSTARAAFGEGPYGCSAEPSFATSLTAIPNVFATYSIDRPGVYGSFSMSATFLTETIGALR